MAKNKNKHSNNNNNHQGGNGGNNNGTAVSTPPIPTTTTTTTPIPTTTTKPNNTSKSYYSRLGLSAGVMLGCIVIAIIAILWNNIFSRTKTTMNNTNSSSSPATNSKPKTTNEENNNKSPPVMSMVKDFAEKLPKYISRRKPFVPPKNPNGVSVVNFARHDLPPVTVGERVIDLMSGVHFDNLLQDTPDEMRPPSLILFTGFETCGDVDKQFKFKSLSETILPSRERLLIAVYDMDANPGRPWYKFTPEMDLKSRFGVKGCGELVYAPRACNGFTIWCERKTDDPLVTKAGCANYTDPCASLVQKYDKQRDGSDWVAWVNKLIEKDGEPQISPVLGSYKDQERWILERDEVTTDNEIRNYYLAEAFPAFTPNGYLQIDTPVEVTKWIMDFWHRRKADRVKEMWHSASTQMSFHEKPTSFVSMDQEAFYRDKIANEVIKPIVEKWSGMKPLELTSFYGIREYYDGHWLRNHIDRIDTHVLSVTFTLGKFNLSNPNQLLTPEEVAQQPTWPLEVIAFDGEIHRHAHLPGHMILYESSKLGHGRPFRNLGQGHLGAFVHFKPIHTVEEAGQWEDICNFAREHQQINTKRGQYRSSPVREPNKPVFTKLRYADDTGFESMSNPNSKKKGKSSSSNNRGAPNSVPVTFINESKRRLDIAWIHPETKQYQMVGHVEPMGELKINSYIGHQFQWLEVGGEFKVASGIGGANVVEIKKGVVEYRYR
jgi:hypothetical protein